MARVPTAETPPKGLDAYWLGVWRHALKTLKAQGTWEWELRPLLDEYVMALAYARVAREAGEHPTWDRHAKRAASLADQLALTARGRKAIGLGREVEPDGSASVADELLARRQSRVS